MNLLGDPEKFLGNHLVCQLESLISKSDKLDSTAKSAYVINGKLNPDLIRISTLRDAPVLGAGIDAALYNKEDQI